LINNTRILVKQAGQLVSSQEIDAMKGAINVSELPSGIYIMKVNANDRIVMKRFAKE